LKRLAIRSSNLIAVCFTFIWLRELESIVKLKVWILFFGFGVRQVRVLLACLL
jgi:hypothetical protein